MATTNNTALSAAEKKKKKEAFEAFKAKTQKKPSTSAANTSSSAKTQQNSTTAKANSATVSAAKQQTKKSAATPERHAAFEAFKAKTQKPRSKQGAWYAGATPTAREAVAQMYRVAGDDETRFSELEGMFNDEQNRIGSFAYNPYRYATNYKFIDDLAALGFDVSGGITPEWFAQNAYMQGWYRTTENSYSPAAPLSGRKYDPQQAAGYAYQKLWDAEERTETAEAEYSQLAADVQYYVDRGYSDTAIMQIVKKDFDRNYKTLSAMDEGRTSGVPVILNRPVDYSGDDTLYGMIHAARNGGGSGDYFLDAVNYTLGRGTFYTFDPASDAARDPSNAHDYHPYAMGSSMDDFNRKYGVQRVDDAWLEANRWMLNGTEDEAKDWNRAYEANETWKAADAELKDLTEYVDGLISGGASLQTVQSKFAARLADGSHKTLEKMESMRSRGGSIDVGDAIDFTVPRFNEMIAQRIAERDAQTAEATAQTEAQEATKTEVQDAGLVSNKFGSNPLDAKQQAEDYAESKGFIVQVTDAIAAAWKNALTKQNLANEKGDEESAEAAQTAIDELDAILAEESAKTKEDDQAAQELAANAYKDQVAWKLFERESGDAPRDPYAMYNPDDPFDMPAPDDRLLSEVNTEEIDVGARIQGWGISEMLKGGEWDASAYEDFMSRLTPVERRNVEIELEDGLEAILSGRASANEGSLAWSWYNAHQNLFGKSTRPTDDERHWGVTAQEQDEFQALVDAASPRWDMPSRIKEALDANDKAREDGVISPDQYWQNIFAISEVNDAVQAAFKEEPEKNGRTQDELLNGWFDGVSRVSGVQGQIDIAYQDAEKLQQEMAAQAKAITEDVMQDARAGKTLDAAGSQVAQIVRSQSITEFDTGPYMEGSRAAIDALLTPEALLADGFTVDTNYGMENMKDSDPSEGLLSFLVAAGKDTISAGQMTKAAEAYAGFVRGIVDDGLREDAKWASALGMTMEEYFAAYPEYAKSPEQRVREARQEFDGIWENFSRDLQGMKEANASMNPDGEDVQPKRYGLLGQVGAKWDVFNYIYDSREEGKTLSDFLKADPEKAENAAKAMGFYLQDEDTGKYSYDYDGMYEYLDEMEANGQITRQSPFQIGIGDMGISPVYQRIEDYHTGVGTREALGQGVVAAEEGLTQSIIDGWNFWTNKSVPDEYKVAELKRRYGDDPAAYRAEIEKAIGQYEEGSEERKAYERRLENADKLGDVFLFGQTPEEMQTDYQSWAHEENAEAAREVVRKFGTETEQKMETVAENLARSATFMAVSGAGEIAGISGVVASILASVALNGSMGMKYVNEGAPWLTSALATIGYDVFEGWTERVFYVGTLGWAMGEKTAANTVTGRLLSKAGAALGRTNAGAAIAKGLKAFAKTALGGAVVETVDSLIDENLQELTQQLAEEAANQAAIGEGTLLERAGAGLKDWAGEAASILENTTADTLIMNAFQKALGVNYNLQISESNNSGEISTTASSNVSDALSAYVNAVIGNKINEGMDAQTAFNAVQSAGQELAELHESDMYKQYAAGVVDAESGAAELQGLAAERDNARAAYEAAKGELDARTQALNERDFAQNPYTAEEVKEDEQLLNLAVAQESAYAAAQEAYDRQAQQVEAMTATLDAQYKALEAEYAKIMGAHTEAAQEQTEADFFGDMSEEAKQAQMAFLGACRKFRELETAAANMQRDLAAMEGVYDEDSKEVRDLRAAYGRTLTEIEQTWSAVKELKAVADEATERTNPEMADVNMFVPLPDVSRSFKKEYDANLTYARAMERADKAADGDLAALKKRVESAYAEAEKDALDPNKAEYAEALNRQYMGALSESALGMVRKNAARGYLSLDAATRDQAIGAYEAAVKEAQQDAEGYRPETAAQKRLREATEAYKGFTDFDLQVEQSDNHEEAVAAHDELMNAMNDVAVERAELALNEAMRSGDVDAVKAAQKALDAAREERAEYALTNPSARTVVANAMLGASSQEYNGLRDALRNGDKGAAVTHIGNILSGVDAETVRDAAGVRGSTADVELLPDAQTGAKGKAGFTNAMSKEAQTAMDAESRQRVKDHGRILKALGQKYGLEFVMRDTLSNVRGAVNGVYTSGNTIYVAADAAMQGYAQAGFHEATHWIEKNDAAAFADLAGFVRDRLTEQGTDWNALIAEKIAKYASMGVTLTRDGAIGEIVAESCGQILSDEQNMQAFASEHRNVFQKVMDRFMNFWKELRSISQRIANTYNNKEAQAFLDDTEGIRKLYENFKKAAEATKATVEASTTNQETEAAVSSGAKVAPVAAEQNGEGASLSLNSEFSDADATSIVTDTADDIMEMPRNRYSLNTYAEQDIKPGLSEAFCKRNGIPYKKVRLLNGKTAIMASGRDITSYVLRDYARRDEAMTFLDKVSDYMSDAGVRYQYLGLDDINNAKVTYDRRTGKVILSCVVKNGEYPINFDFTKSCKKREALSRFFDDLATSEGRNGGANMLVEMDLTPEHLFKLNGILREAGYETACPGCFVEARRYYIKSWGNRIVDEWNAAVEAVNPDAGYFDFAQGETNVNAMSDEEVTAFFNDMKSYDKNKKGLNSPADKMSVLAAQSPMLQKKLRLSDLITRQGRTALHEFSPELESIVASRSGSGSPKSVEAFAPYNSNIALLPDDKTINGKKMPFKDYLKSIAGVRTNSFSDFIVSQALDYLQKDFDTAAREMTAHAYTKEAARAKLLGMLGEKINMSVMFEIDPRAGWENAGLNTSGDYLVADYEHADELLEVMRAQGGEKANATRPFIFSVPMSQAVQIQNDPTYSKNCGIIGVGYSYNHNKKMLADREVPYIIAYHRSGLPEVVAVATSVRYGADYTPVQNTMTMNGFSVVTNADSTSVPPYATWGMTAKKDLSASDAAFDLKAALAENNGDATATMDQFLRFMQENSLTPNTQKAFAGHGEFDLYGSLERTNDPKATADEYIRWCIENDTLPLLFEFANDPNYYKFLFDFSVTDLATGETAQQAPMSLDALLDMGADEWIGMLDHYMQQQENDLAEKYASETYNATKEKLYEAALHGDPNSADFSEEAASEDDASYSLNAQQMDADYMAAVKSGNVEEQQRLVDEAARRAGYTVKAYHGTSKNFTVFDRDRIGSATDYGFYGRGFYFADKKSVADYYAGYLPGSHVIDSYLKIDNLFDFGESRDLGAVMSQIMGTEYKESGELSEKELAQRSQDFSDWLRANGYDGVKAGGQYMVLNPDQVKSANPITYDDAGNVIPLSQRFNPQSEDIRYSMNPNLTDDEVYASMADQLANGSPNARKIADLLLQEAGKKAAEMQNGTRRAVNVQGLRDHRAPTRNAANAQPNTNNRRNGELQNPIQIMRDFTNRIRVGYNPGGQMFVNGHRERRVVMGFYNDRAHSITTRTNVAGDLAIALHEAGHAAQQRLPNLHATQQMIDDMPDGVRDMYQGAELDGEAVAEFFVDYMYSRDQAIAVAGQQYVEDFERMLHTDPELDRAITDARDRIYRWNTAEAAGRMDAMISETREQRSRDMDTRRLVTRWADRLEARFASRAASARIVGDDLYEAARWLPHARKRSGRILTDSLITPDGAVIGDGMTRRLRRLRASRADIQEGIRFGLARHALDRLAQGKPVFTEAEFSEADLRGIVNDTTANNPKAVQVADALVGFWREFRNAWLVDTGRLSKADADKFDTMYPNYLPTFRVTDKKLNRNSGGNANFVIRGAVQGGSSLEVVDPMNSIVNMVNQVVNTVSKNRVLQVFHNAMQNGDFGWLATEVTSKMRKTTVDVTEAKEKLDNLRSAQIGAVGQMYADAMDESMDVYDILGEMEQRAREDGTDLNETMRIFADISDLNDAIAAMQEQWRDTHQNNGANIVSGVDENGHQFFYKINGRYGPLFNLLSGSGDTMSKAASVAKKVRSAFTQLVTGKNPAFSLTNIPRDLWTTTTTGTHSWTILGGAARYLWSFGELLANTPVAQEWKNLGGGQETMYRADSGNDINDLLDMAAPGRNFGSVVRRTAKRTMNIVTLSPVTEAFENAGKFVEYRFGRGDRDTQENRVRKFLDSQNVTVDFSEKGFGIIATFLSTVVPFGTATVNGLNKDMRVVRGIFSEDGAQQLRAAEVLAKNVLNMGLLAALQAFIIGGADDDDKEEMDMLADYIKAGFFVVPCPDDWLNKHAYDRTVIRIPLAQSAITKSIYAAMYNIAGDVANLDEMSLDLMDTAASIFWDSMPNSTIFSGYLDAKSNRTHYGGSIVSESAMKRSAPNQYNSSTLGSLKDLSAWLYDDVGFAISPAVMQYVFEQYSGVIGQTIIPFASPDKYTGEWSPLGGIKNVLYTISKRLTIDPVATTDIGDNFYEARDTFNRIIADDRAGDPIHDLPRLMDDEERSDAVNEAKQALKKGGFFYEANRQVSDLWDDISAIEQSEVYTDAEKAIRVKELRKQINRIEQEALIEYATYLEKYAIKDPAGKHFIKAFQNK